MTDPERPSPDRDPGNGLVRSIQRAEGRRERARREGEPTLASQLARVGVLGWIVVIPALGSLALGQWLDRQLSTRPGFTAPLLVLGIGIGCWLGWRWMRRA